MTQPKPFTSGNDGPLLSPREEAERFAIAAERFLERARQNPEVATQMLRDIGYFEMMEQQRLEEQEEAEMGGNGTHAGGLENGVIASHSVETGENSQR